MTRTHARTKLNVLKTEMVLTTVSVLLATGVLTVASKTPAHQTLANMAVHAVTITELPYANARENGQDHCAKNARVRREVCQEFLILHAISMENAFAQQDTLSISSGGCVLKIKRVEEMPAFLDPVSTTVSVKVLQTDNTPANVHLATSERTVQLKIRVFRIHAIIMEYVTATRRQENLSNVTVHLNFLCHHSVTAKINQELDHVMISHVKMVEHA